MPRLHELLTYLKDRNGSDLHLSAGLEPRIRRHGALEAVAGWPALDDDGVRALLRETATDAQWEEFQSAHDLDFAYGLEGVARFRVNYYLQQHGAGAVFRLIPERIVTLEELDLPQAIGELARLRSGLVLVTGPTGSGKSTTLAAIIDRINSLHSKHIVTIEDPVEFVHRNRRCLISQREVGHDTESFSAALRSAIRQDADVILVGEMRDLDTIALAVTAAEMGALVLGTLHTNSAVNTIDRLIDAFPADEQAQIRTVLSESLAAVVSQQLLRTADGQGRCAAVELLLRTPGLPNIIREANTPMIVSIIQGGRALGMQTMDDALAAMVEAGRINAREAYLKATNKARFDSKAESPS
ncbi:MAG TPA: type IV pilus twitching motility protein PilT [Thermoanaerobaculia bacterium]|nr:type IV pilus twitching motility protein PilT [Thermoanaerobaculia bacterium]